MRSFSAHMVLKPHMVSSGFRKVPGFPMGSSLVSILGKALPGQPLSPYRLAVGLASDILSDCQAAGLPDIPLGLRPFVSFMGQNREPPPPNGIGVPFGFRLKQGDQG